MQDKRGNEELKGTAGGREPESSNAKALWELFERWWKLNRPLRGDSEKSNMDRLRTLQEVSREILAHIEVAGGVRLEPSTRSVKVVREPDIMPGGGFLTALLAAQVLGEAAVMAPRRFLSGLTGVNGHHREGHTRRGKPWPRESREVALYRGVRLAFFWLRRAPKRLASIVQGDLSDGEAVLPSLLGWALTRVNRRKRKRLREALKGECFETRFLAPLAVALAKHHDADPFVGRKSVLSRAIYNLGKEASEDVLHKRAVPRGSLDPQDEDDFALRLEMKDALEMEVERVGLTPAEKEVAILRLVGELSDACIASRTGRSKSTVRGLLARAVKKLQRAAKES